MVLIIVFLICILFGVHANDPISTSFNRSSLPISLPRPFKLDNVHSQFSLCLKEKVEAQNENLNVHSLAKSIFFLRVLFIACGRCIHTTQCIRRLQMPIYCALKNMGKIYLMLEIAYMNGMTFRPKYIEMSYIKKSKT